MPRLTPDPHSYARPTEVVVRRMALDLDVDLDRQRLAGSVTFDVERVDPEATELALDTWHLDLGAVTDGDGTPLEHHVGEHDEILGAPLTIRLGDTDRVVVHYATTDKATALQWLGAEQTSSGQPFLFTQSQPILARSWIPCQDSPGIRAPYDATVRVPAHLMAVMSAENPTERSADGQYRFTMPEPVPTYLVALAVGDLRFRELGARSGVYAEEAVVEKAAWEFADTEAMIEAAERLYGPYRWGRYDILVLPASFPFGGMENPLLTFATPTILAGDRSLVSLVAHELAHSWSGNLVTNATWDDFWLNEGFTSYFENRIMESVYGAEYAQMLESLSRTGLDQELQELDEADQHLHLALEGRDPDDGMNAIAYDKGALFVRHMETVAGRERFDEYLRGYFDRYAFQPMTAERFVADLNEHLIQGDAELAEAINADAWIYGPGLPEGAPRVESEAFARVEEQAAAFASGTAPAETGWGEWSTHERVHFLQSLPDELTDEQLAELNGAFGLNETGNSEIRFAWLKVAIANEYEPAVASLEAFLTEQGRRKFVLPLFEDLAASEWGRPIADRIYAEARPGYHTITSGSVDAALADA